MPVNSMIEIAKKLGAFFLFTVGKGSDEIHKGWLIVESCVVVATVLFFNFTYQWAAVLLSDPVLAPSIPVTINIHGLPLLNLWLALALIVNALNLRSGRWTRLTRYAGAAVALMAITVLGLMLIGGPAISLNPHWAAAQTARQDLIQLEAQTLPLMNGAFRISLGVTWMAMFFVFIQRVARLLRHETVATSTMVWPGGKQGIDLTG